MKYLLAAVILFALCRPVSAQTNEVDWNAVADSAQQWAQQNLDDDALRALQNVDRDKVEDFLKHYQDYLNGSYVLDVAQLKAAANAILPVLNAHEETQPYAAWLRSRLDYFEAAEEMEAAAPKGATNPTAFSNPSFKTQQQVWNKELAARPWPKAAVAMVPKLKPIFDREGMPAELVWIAEVESGFDDSARSPAGAAGMFQLMPLTAKDSGLSLCREINGASLNSRPGPPQNIYAGFTAGLATGDWRSQPTIVAGELCRRPFNAITHPAMRPLPRICRPKRRCTCPRWKPPSGNAKGGNWNI